MFCFAFLCWKKLCLPPGPLPPQKKQQKKKQQQQQTNKPGFTTVKPYVYDPQYNIICFTMYVEPAMLLYVEPILNALIILTTKDAAYVFNSVQGSKILNIEFGPLSIPAFFSPHVNV